MSPERPRFKQTLPASTSNVLCLFVTKLIDYSLDFFQVTFVLDYTPKFIVPPIVYEKVNVTQNQSMMQTGL